MKRRGFFGALFAGAAAPVAAAIGSKLADAELALPVEPAAKVPAPMAVHRWDYDGSVTAPCSVSCDNVPRLKDDPAGYDEYHGIVKCAHCGSRVFGHYLECSQCGAPLS
jgi:hypothetical protein